MPLKKSATRYKQKQKYFSLPDYQLSKNMVLIFSSCERKKKRINTEQKVKFSINYFFSKSD